MECVVASVEHIQFDIEIELDQQYGALPLPFPGMDSKLIKNIVFKYSVSFEVLAMI